VIGEEVPLGSRIFGAAYTLILNAVVWIGLPLVFSPGIATLFPTLPITNPEFIYAFGGTITGLQVIGALTQGKAVSAIFISGAYVDSAYFVWVAGGGGIITVAVAGSVVTLAYKTTLFLLVLPSLLGAIRAPLSFLFEQSEAGQPARELP